MAKSLAELRATRPQSRPERSVTLCLVPALVAEVQSLTEELTDLSGRKEPGEGSPRRMGQGLGARATEIQARLTELLEEMAEHEGELRLRATRTDGEWRRWCNEHPAREEGEPGYDRDMRVTSGYCNADDLLDDLATYALSWNGEPLAPTDFADIIEPATSTADKAEIATAVVSMYESRLDFPRLRSSLSASLKRSSALNSPQPSESPTSDSTDGNPAPSSEATTLTVTA